MQSLLQQQVLFHPHHHECKSNALHMSNIIAYDTLNTPQQTVVAFMYSLIISIILGILTIPLAASTDAAPSPEECDRIAAIAADLYSRTNPDIIAQYNTTEWIDGVLKKRDLNPAFIALLLDRLPKYIAHIKRSLQKIAAKEVSLEDIQYKYDYILLQRALDTGAALTKKLSLMDPQPACYESFENAFSLFFLTLKESSICPSDLIDFTPACIVLHSIKITPTTPFTHAEIDLCYSDSDPDSDRYSTGSSSTYTSAASTLPDRPSSGPLLSSPPTAERSVIPAEVDDIHHSD